MSASAEYEDLRDTLADGYAVEIAAAAARYKLEETLDDFDNGDQLRPLLPDFPTPGAPAEHPNIYAEKLGILGYEPKDDVPIGETVQEFEEYVSAIDTTLEDITGFFYLVEHEAFEAAKAAKEAAQDTDYDHWTHTFDEIMEDEEEEADQLAGRLEREHGWHEEYDEITPDVVEDELGISFNPGASA